MAGQPFPLQDHLPGVSRLAFGCMGLGGSWGTQTLTPVDHKLAAAAVGAAVEAGINLFDHADIYKQGRAEQVFGRVLSKRPGLREQIFIQSKGGIRFPGGDVPGRYDFAGEWITTCVDGSLDRLGVDYLDLWLLHRPDRLMEPAEVAAVFEQLRTAGKVRQFGVSNMNRHQLELLQAALPFSLVANQVELSLAQLDWLETGGFPGDGASAGTLEHCRRHRIQLQAWGSLAGGLYSGKPMAGESDAVRATAGRVVELAEQHRCSAEAIVLAWLLRHPAAVQPVIGSTNTERIRACAQAASVSLSREEWYELYVSSRGEELP